MIKEKFQQAEKKGREIWYSTISGKSEVEWTTGEFDGVDGYITAHTVSVFEIKNRDIPSDKYANKGILLEKKKYDALLKAQREHNAEKALYVNIFRDKIIVWDINSLKQPLKWEYRYCTPTTAENYQKRAKRKQITLLNVKDAIWNQTRKNNI